MVSSRALMGDAPSLGEEWIVDAHACEPALLRDLAHVKAALDAIVSTMNLRVVGDPMLHKFGGEGGVTGLYLLAESHLACHTYPEHGSLTLNLYSCKKKAPFDFRMHLGKSFGAGVVRVVRVARGEYVDAATSAEEARQEA